MKNALFMGVCGLMVAPLGGCAGPAGVPAGYAATHTAQTPVVQYPVHHIADPDRGATHPGLVYGAGRTRMGLSDLLVDVYEPEGTPPEQGWPAVVVTHGGAFTFGSRTQAHQVKLAQTLAANGYLAAVIDYRLVPDQPVPQDKALYRYYRDKHPLYTPDGPKQRLAFISAVEDLSKAVGWLRADAPVSVNPKRVFLAGDSAGSMASMHAAYSHNDAGLTPLGVAGVLSFWGALNVTDERTQEIQAGEPPLFMVHGDQDSIVSVEFSRISYRKAKAAGIEVEYFELPGYEHDYQNVDLYAPHFDDGSAIFDRMLHFMGRHSAK